MMNIQNLFKAYTQLMQNPSQFLQKLNIPVEYANDPNAAIQHLMKTGRISQADYNNANNQFKQMQNNPLFKQFFNK